MPTAEAKRARRSRRNVCSRSPTWSRREIGGPQQRETPTTTSRCCAGAARQPHGAGAESLAGEPAVLRVPAAMPRCARIARRARVQPLPAGEWRLRLRRRGESVDLVAPGIGTDAVLAPVAQEPGSPVPFGVR